MCIATAPIEAPILLQECNHTTSSRSLRNNQRRKRRRVQFAEQVFSVHTISTLVDGTDDIGTTKKDLWYSPSQLTQLLEHELHCNWALKTLIGSNNHCEEGIAAEWLKLTWRGLEVYCQPDAAATRRAHIRAHVQVILSETRRNQNKESVRFVSESLSQEDKAKAHQKGLQDAAISEKWSVCLRVWKGADLKAQPANFFPKYLPEQAILTLILRFLFMFLVCAAMTKP